MCASVRSGRGSSGSDSWPDCRLAARRVNAGMYRLEKSVDSAKLVTSMAAPLAYIAGKPYPVQATAGCRETRLGGQ